MNFMTIASGSSGNCIYVGTDSTSILVDVGISKKKIVEELNDINLDIRDVSGIFITHEHIDHIKGLGVISRAYNIPIYATEDTIDMIKQTSSLGTIDSDLFNSIVPDEMYSIGDINIKAHSIWHDAADPVCYSFFNNNNKVSIATDLGDYDDYIINNLKESDVLLVEANHDVRMLQAGFYPYNLKQRILGKRGHLSNEAGGKLIKELLNDHIKSIFLGHLSADNNYPELAYETVKCELADNKFSKDVRNFNLQVAKRSNRSELISI